MNTYIVFINDHHTDPIIRVFSTYEKAKVYYDRYLSRFDNVNKQKLSNGMIADGWVEYANYEYEEDFVIILKREIDSSTEEVF